MEEVVTHGFNMEHYLPGHPFPVLSPEPCPPMKAVTVEPKTCSSKDYLEMFIFPVLLPGMANLLHQAKREKCFERKRTKFIGCDFLTEWLYNQNPKRAGEPFTEFFSIPFVEKWLEHHPRPPIPLSLLLTEEEAAISIQSFWRAYLVRCDPEIQELRQWQKKLREDNHIRQRVKIFWAKQEQKSFRVPEGVGGQGLLRKMQSIPGFEGPVPLLMGSRILDACSIFMQLYSQQKRYICACDRI
ncbi:IQ domain-containing protein K isoform X5 [Mesocricetus auratus]|nr:IQ domain-containing protein K isoform X5 [Mesocricetus auratus]